MNTDQPGGNETRISRSKRIGFSIRASAFRESVFIRGFSNQSLGMNAFQNSSTRTIQPFEPERGGVYPIETAALLAHIPRRTVLLYCRHLLIAPVSDPEHDGYYFDDEAIRTMQRIEFLHSVHGINLIGTRMILELMSLLDRSRGEARTA